MRVARVSSRRSVDALGVVRSWGSTSGEPVSTTSSAPITPTVWRVVRPRRRTSSGRASATAPGPRRARRRADPRIEPFGGGSVAAGAVGLARHVDVHDVVLVAPGQVVEVGLGQHVVGRRDDIAARSVLGCVAQRSERLESGHVARLARAAACASIAGRGPRRADPVRSGRGRVAGAPPDPRLGRRPSPGCGLRARPVLFVTNNSGDTIARQEQALAAVGIPAEGAVLTSSMAAAELLQPGERALVVGGAGIFEALESRGVHALDAHATRHRTGSTRWSSASIAASTTRRCAGRARRSGAGARLIGTNDDATYPTAAGPIPGGGSILAAVVTASGVAARDRRETARGDGRTRPRSCYGPAGRSGVGGRRPSRSPTVRFAAPSAAASRCVHVGRDDRRDAVRPPPDLVAADLGRGRHYALGPWLTRC